MIQTKKQELIADTIEKEKRQLFCYACYRLGDANEAEDILQDLFVTLCATPGVIENTKNLKSYIFRSLSNKCNTLLRNRQKLQIVDIDSKEVSEKEDSQPTNFEQEYTLINRLLNTIPQEQSEVIRLHIHGEKTFKEIADILEIPESSVKSRYRYGIEKLRREIKK
ncbi:MAG: RNA polymerase sigma factor [Bacteroidales bacterium]|nr:RNA polymerase sigma factor [Bacteroidales bacterium]MBR2606509.1 RNA polymerase sigma factor [Bacteroidaceae bacterium]